MGGPALHVAYLSAGLRSEATPRHSSPARSRGARSRWRTSSRSAAFASSRSPGCPRDLALARRARRRPARGADPAVRPTILHTHTAKAGAMGRIAAMLAGDARPPIVVHTFHGHVLRGYFEPDSAPRSSACSSGCSRGVTTALVAVSPEVRDDLVALGVAPAEKFAVVRLGIELEERVRSRRAARARSAPARHPAGPLRRRLDRSDDRRQADGRRARRARRCCASAGSTRACCWSATAPTGRRSSGARRSSGSIRHCLFLGYQEEVAP